ncbi:hypothetical protein [Aquimarina pacifica]|uniref:hypothetical protein n=1 Tax=Aquimarina pacifica TaxID=1296415 RepID=UPI00046ECB06|nr:hypothetical protein [Aquimarina pacifica]
MIAGETEMLLNEEYDDFIFGNKEKRAARKKARQEKRALRRNAPKRIERRKRRKDTLQKIGQAVTDLGGATAIGGAVDTLLNTSDPIQGQPTVNTPSDYAVGIGAKEPEDQKKGKSTTTLILYGVIGILVVGGVGTLIYQSQKNKYISIQKN